MSCIYLIWQDKTSYYKIGKADNPKKRIKDLQTGHSNRLHLIAHMECQDPLRKEVYLHRKYNAYRTQGEWFSIPPTLIHQVFAEFQFHVEETPDECIHYWAALAQKWHDIAHKQKESVLNSFNEIKDFGSYVLDRFSENQAFSGLLDENEKSLRDEMMQHIDSDVLLPLFSKHCANNSEIILVAKQVGI